MIDELAPVHRFRRFGFLSTVEAVRAELVLAEHVTRAVLCQSGALIVYTIVPILEPRFFFLILGARFMVLYEVFGIRVEP